MSSVTVQPGASGETATGETSILASNISSPGTPSIADEINRLLSELCMDLLRKLQSRADAAELECDYIGGTNQLPFIKLAWLSATKEEQREFRAWLKERRPAAQRKKLIEALKLEVERLRRHL